MSTTSTKSTPSTNSTGQPPWGWWHRFFAWLIIGGDRKLLLKRRIEPSRPWPRPEAAEFSKFYPLEPGEETPPPPPSPPPLRGLAESGKFYPLGPGEDSPPPPPPRRDVPRPEGAVLPEIKPPPEVRCALCALRDLEIMELREQLIRTKFELLVPPPFLRPSILMTNQKLAEAIKATQDQLARPPSGVIDAYPDILTRDHLAALLHVQRARAEYMILLPPAAGGKP